MPVLILLAVKMLRGMSRRALAVTGLIIFILAIVLFNLHQRNKLPKLPVITDYIPGWKVTCQECSQQPESDFWKSVNVSAVTARQLIDYFHWTNRSSCRLTHDFGGFMLKNPSGFDGQKAVCLDAQVAPRPDNCLVYSFGINNEWSFDDTMEQYGCEIFSFDPSMGKEDHNRTDKIHFFNLGLDNEDKGNSQRWKLNRLRTIYEKLNHQERIIDYLKVDIETAEWRVIPDIIESGMMNRIRQMGIEIHLPENKPLDDYRTLMGIIKSIEDTGMVRFDSKYNPWFLHGIPMPNLDNYTGSLGFEIAWYQNIPMSSILRKPSLKPITVEPKVT